MLCLDVCSCSFDSKWLFVVGFFICLVKFQSDIFLTLKNGCHVLTASVK